MYRRTFGFFAGFAFSVLLMALWSVIFVRFSVAQDYGMANCVGTCTANQDCLGKSEACKIPTPDCNCTTNAGGCACTVAGGGI
jgi:hypothetical protein